MNKYGTTRKPLESASLIGVCFIILVIVIAIYVFSRPGAGVHIMAPVPIQSFSSPSSATAASIESAAVVYLPSIQAIQLRVGAKPDGILGPETQELWDLAYNNQSCVETWPEIGK